VAGRKGEIENSVPGDREEVGRWPRGKDSKLGRTFPTNYREEGGRWPRERRSWEEHCRQSGRRWLVAEAQGEEELNLGRRFFCDGWKRLGS
jgi:hypothetical protein